jgi:peptidoglycan/LPS O-acetylase OafA/YrhL
MADGRLVLAMACMPQNFFFYDQLPLLLVAKTRRELLGLAVASCLAYDAFMFSPGARLDPFSNATWVQASDARLPFVVLGLYLPAFVLALRRSHLRHPPEGKRDEHDPR